MKLIFTFLAALALAGCDGEHTIPSPPAELSAGNAEAGRAIYNYRCYFCHGYSGDARTLAATYMAPQPTNLTLASPEVLTEARILDALRRGREGTGMKSFAGIISDAEMQQVAAFVYEEFVSGKRPNTRYHTVENGWPDHERYRIAYPFARGDIPLTRPWEELSDEEARGKRLYLSSCVSCHDRGSPAEDPVAWDSRPLSYPRNHYDHATTDHTVAPVVDAVTSASPYARHDVIPDIAGLSDLERSGQRLWQVNCAFCHAADGTGKNWIGAFLEPHPRNLADPQVMKSMTRARLRQAIREGLENTSMPAWKSVLADDQIEAIVAYINRAFHPLSDG